MSKNKVAFLKIEHMMKARVDDRIKTTIDVPGFVIKGIIPKGTEGIIIEAYNQPTEGYAVDMNVVDENAPNGYTYDNVVLFPDQFVVVEE
jgi:hypothetical protein